MFKHIKKVDKIVINNVTKIQKPSLNKLLIPLTKLGSLGLVWLLLAFPMLLTEKFKLTGMKIFLVVFLAGFLGEGLIKNIARRKRPSKYIEEQEMLIKKPDSYSFPSGHTSSSVASAIVIATDCPRLAIPVFVLAFLVSFSRLYLRVHYPSDILAGALFGVILAFFVGYI